MKIRFSGVLHRRLLVGAALVAVLSALAVAALQLPFDAPVRPAAQLKWADSESQAGPLESAIDSDNDGLSDLEENYVWGTDPNRMSTANSGIPDGWLARHGFDPTLPGWQDVALGLPADLPPNLARDDSRLRVNLLDAYGYARPADWSEERDGPWDNQIDPRVAKTPSGIAVSWLLANGLDPRDADVGSLVLLGDDQTVRENYVQGTDPRLRDTDQDGLSDADEVKRHRTDPLKVSTTGSGVPDGFFVRWGLDPLDPTLAQRSLNGKGMTVADVYRYNEDRYGRLASIEGAGLDPRTRSTSGTVVPDGWLVDYGLDPLEASVDAKVLRRASEFPHVRHMTSAPGDPLPPLPDLALTVADAYLFGRPADWDESTLGPWRAGLNPAEPDADEDGLPDVVELRGWYINRTTGFGASAITVPVDVRSDPTVVDTDGDGLLDGEEYFGSVTVEQVSRSFFPSDPGKQDTAFSGMTDGEKVLGYKDKTGKTWHLVSPEAAGIERVWLQPNMTDTDQDGSPDGVEFQYWLGRASEDPAKYGERFPSGSCGSYLDAFGRLPWVRNLGVVPTAALVAKALAPDGDLDADGIPNIIDPDADGDGLLDGWETDPSLLSFSDFASAFPRQASDPANPDTDCDGLPDAWELRYGSYLPAEQRWTLDPTRAKSDGQVLDGDANLDGDGVDWYSYRLENGVLVPRAQRFEFTNAAEFQAGTDPTIADQDQDGIDEAWPFFWGTVYPVLLQDPGPSDLGDRRPDLSDVLAFAPRLSMGNPALAGSSKQPDGESYWRFERTANPLPDIERQERIVRSETARHPTTHAPTTVTTMEGRFVLRFQDEAALGTNPYLLDTDGDGLPDAWEFLHGTCFLATGVASPNPVLADADADPDLDRLTNLQEYAVGRTAGAFGTNPCLADTDLGGLDDGEEAFLRLNPLRSPDDATTSEAGDVDTDGDGVRDIDEIMGGTDPLSVDTDHDGLLDGNDLRFTIQVGDDLPAAAQHLRERGIVYTRQETEGGLLLVFKGEASGGTHPAKASSVNDGIPDGWKLGYGLRTDQKRADLLVRYVHARPAWWVEPVHGVWWWGLPPTGTVPLGTRDADQDGLDDFNGEDPVPAARHSCCLSRTHPTTAADDDEAWILAQAYGEDAGNPLAARNGWSTADYDTNGVLDAHDRIPTATTLLSIEQPAGTALASGSILRKGEAAPFVATGRVLTDCRGAFTCTSGTPVANRAVALFLEAPHNTVALGYAVTGSDGWFSIPACVCAPHAYQHATPGIAILNTVSGTASWTHPAQDVPHGEHRLTARSFNSTSTFWNDPSRDATHPQWVSIPATFNGRPITSHATAGSTSSPWAVTLGSATQMRVSTAPHVPWSSTARTLAADIELEDATGRPLVDEEVLVSFAGQTLTSPRTGPEGRAQVVFSIPSTVSLEAPVRATFAGHEPILLASQAASAPVTVQGPSGISLEPVASRVGTGDQLVVRGRLTATTEGLAGQTVQLTLAAQDVGGAVAASALTGGDGAFSFTIPVPPTFRGEAALRLHYAGDPLHAPSEASASTTVLMGTRINVVALPTHVNAGTPFLVQGKLSDAAGRLLHGHTVELRPPTGPRLQVLTHEGAFRLSVTLANNTAPGPVALLLVHPAQQDHAESHLDVTLRLTRPTTIGMPPGTAPRGSESPIRGHLLDAAGSPLGGQDITVRMHGRDVGRAVTDAAGAFTVAWAVPSNASLGPAVLVANFAGSQDGRFGANQSTSTWTIRDASELVVDAPSGPMARDALSVQGLLRTHAGSPIPDAEIILRESKIVLARANTSDLGRWSLRFSLPPNRSAADHSFTVHYAGNETLARAQAPAQVRSQAATIIDAVVPPVLGRGQTAEIPISVRERGGPPVQDPWLTWRIGPSNGSARLDSLGVLAIPLPPDLPLGPTRLVIEYAGDAYRVASRNESTPIIRAAAHLQLVEPIPPLGPGESSLVRARLTGPDGEPVAGQTVALVLDPQGAPLLGTTDANGVVAFPVTASGAGETGFSLRFAGNEALAPTSLSNTVHVVAPGLPKATQAALALSLVAFCAALALGGWLWLRFRPLMGVRESLRRAVDQLVAGDDASAAILLAYQKLSNTLQKYGYMERGSETAAEFLHGLLKFLPTRRDYVSTLTDLFDRARYGEAALTIDDRQDALACLRGLLLDVDGLILSLRRRAPGVPS